MPQGVANRDIKLENILLDESEPRPLIKICDFGYSKVGSRQDTPWHGSALALYCVGTRLKQAIAVLSLCVCSYPWLPCHIHVMLDVMQHGIVRADAL